MEILGRIKKILNTITFSSGFRKRELVVLTDELYPQNILVEFLQEKIHLLDKFKTNDYIKIYIKIRGREWINSEGIVKYLNSIQGWKIEKLKSKESTSSNIIYDNFYDLPF